MIKWAAILMTLDLKQILGQDPWFSMDEVIRFVGEYDSMKYWPFEEECKIGSHLPL